jgi:PncC family amidohydrolase
MSTERDLFRIVDRDRTTVATAAELLAGRQIALAESCTAGRIAATLATVDGASRFFAGGVVAYEERVKREVLGVMSPSVLCGEAAVEMARGVAQLLGADATLATTGVAGPEPIEGVRPGTVFVATMVGDECRSAELHFGGTPEEVCAEAAEHALMMLIRHLEAAGEAEAVGGQVAEASSL